MADEPEEPIPNGNEDEPDVRAGSTRWEDDPYELMQRAILDKALIHAGIDGWSREVLAQAALEAGYAEGDADLAFPRGAVDAVLAHATFADHDMIDEMQTLDLEKMKTRDKIAIAIRVRLESQIANREAVAKGLRLLADPRYAPQSAASLARTVDTIWKLAGDDSTDFNYYTKRGLLAGVYSATLLYWLNDSSEDQRKTWEFLNNRISAVLRFGRATAGLSRIASRMPNPLRLCGTSKRRWREGPVHR